MTQINQEGHSKRHPKMVFLFALASFLFFCDESFAQQWPFELWHEGKIVLVDGDTLKGMVKYDLQQDVVQFTSSDQNAVVFSARKILYFEIYDNTVHQYRQFFALPYSTGGSYQSLIFFELLADGRMTLLCREALEYRSVPVGYYGSTYNRLIMVYQFFIMNEKGEISSFTGKRNDLMELMGKNADAVGKFMKTNKLRIEEKIDFSRIVAYYNSLQRT